MVEQDISVEEKMSIIGRKLVAGLGDLIRALPGKVSRPQDLSRALGVNKDVSSRIFRAMARADPLAVTGIMPGPGPLRQLLEAARAKGLPTSVMRPADEAVVEFEHLIRVDVGDRGSLDGIISSAIPETRQKYELVNKQSAYRGMSQLKGVTADVCLTAACICAGDDPEYVDGVWVLAWRGLRRVRRNAVAYFHAGRIGKHASQDPTCALSGEPIRGPKDVLLGEYCSSPLAPLRTHCEGTTVHYMLGGDGVALSSAVDITMASRTPRCLKRYNEPERPRLQGPTMEIAVPCKVAIFDVFVERDIFPGGLPELRVYDTVIKGLADMNDPGRNVDRLDLRESVEFLGEGAIGIRVVEIPRYSEIIAEVLRRVGRPVEHFRAYRCRSQYPVYGTQYSMCFTAPVEN